MRRGILRNSVVQLVACSLASLVVAVCTSAARADSIDYHAAAWYTTKGSPGDYTVDPGGSLDGVGYLHVSRSDGNFVLSGALLADGRHFLTAAHGLTDDSGAFNTNSAWAEFEGDTGRKTANVVDYHVHPDWNGDFLRGYDIAVLEFSGNVSSDITRYDIYTGSSEVGSVGQKVGYGRSGNGNDGSILAAGTKRTGLNLYDDYADTMMTAIGRTPGTDFVEEAILQYDFDNGLAENDAFGVWFGNNDTGEGEDEVASAPGDSGGPTFIDGKIAGVTSYGITLQSGGDYSSDIDEELNSTFGEFSGDTRVSYYSDWIGQFLEAGQVPAPSAAVGLLGMLLTGLSLASGRRRR